MLQQGVPLPQAALAGPVQPLILMPQPAAPPPVHPEGPATAVPSFILAVPNTVLLLCATQPAAPQGHHTSVPVSTQVCRKREQESKRAGIGACKYMKKN